MVNLLLETLRSFEGKHQFLCRIKSADAEYVALQLLARRRMRYAIYAGSGSDVVDQSNRVGDDEEHEYVCGITLEHYLFVDGKVNNNYVFDNFKHQSRITTKLLQEFHVTDEVRYTEVMGRRAEQSLAIQIR